MRAGGRSRPEVRGRDLHPIGDGPGRGQGPRHLLQGEAAGPGSVCVPGAEVVRIAGIFQHCHLTVTQASPRPDTLAPAQPRYFSQRTGVPN